MKIIEKGGYKRVCFWILLCWWAIHIVGYLLSRWASSRIAKDEGLSLYDAEKLHLDVIVWSSILLWMAITVFYGLFFFNDQASS